MKKKAGSTLLLFFMLSCSWFPLLSSCTFFHDPGGESSLIRQRDTAKFFHGIRPYRGDTESHYLLGCYFQERNRHELAVEEFMIAVEIEPAHARSYNGMGVSYDSLGDFAKAIESYKKALDIDPELDYVHNNLGYAYLLNGNMELAVHSFKQAIALNNKESLYHNNLGLAYAMNGKYDPAFSEFKQSVGDAEGHIFLAKILYKNNLSSANRKPHRKVDAEKALASIFSVPTLPSRQSTDTGAAMIASVALDEDTLERASLAVKIEVSNGNGVNNMAKNVGEYLRTKGFLPVNSTNAENFNRLKTSIYCKSGYQSQAHKVAHCLPGEQKIEMVSTLPKEHTVIRVVIGKDLIPYLSLFQKSS